MSHPSTSGLPPHDTKQEESDDDEDLFTVPDVESDGPTSTAAEEALNRQQQQQLSNSSEGQQSQKNRRGRNPADREYGKLKRLLRNRVSAQQARERKKVYMNDLESRATELHDNNLELEEKISTLVNENTMLRKVLMSTRPKVYKSMELKNDQSGNS